MPASVELPEGLRSIAQLANATAELITVSDPAGTIVFISQAAERLLGFRPEQMIGRFIYDFLHPEDSARLLASRDRRMSSGEATESRTLMADGGFRWMENRSWQHEAGGQRYVVSIARDIQARKETEESIRRASEALATQADASPDGVLVVSPEGRVVSWNHRLLALLEMEEAQLRQGDVTVLTQLLAERLVDPEAYRRAAAATLVHGTQTLRLELHSGRVLERTRIVPAAASKTRPDIVLLYRDVTAQALAERQLQARASQQAAVASLSQQALAAAAPEAIFAEAVRLCSEALSLDVCLILELQPHLGGVAVRAARNYSARTGDVISLVEAELATTVIAQGTPIQVDDWPSETRFRCPSLRAQGVQVGINVPIFCGGRAVAVLGAHRKTRAPFDAQDLAFLVSMANVLGAFLDRQRADEALRRSEESLRKLIEEAPDTILIHREGVLVYGNAVLRRYLGAKTVEEVIGRHLKSFTHPDDLALTARRLDEQREGRNHDVPAELRMMCADGKERLHEVVSLPMVFEGQPAVISFGRDLSERRELQLRLQLADRMVSVGTLAAGVAHELNNPLAYVMANLQFLSDELRVFAPHLEATEVAARIQVAQEALREAQEGASRLRVIVRDLSTFSRGEGDARGPVDLRPVVESSLNMALNQIRHRATVVRKLGPVPRVFGNAARLGQVVLNLLVNAAQAIPEGNAKENRIEVSTALVDGMVQMEVRDTGAGIPAKMLSRIFDPFFTTKAPGVGTGLGLSICHSIVTSMGGRIEVESAPGKGTCFRVMLPPTDTRSNPVLAAMPAAAVFRGRLLVVDDEPLVGMALRRALQRDHEVTVLQSGRRAQELLAAGEPFDAVISDLLMPDCSGMELYDSLRKLRPELVARTIFLTGGAFTDAAREFLEQPGVRSLEKPFEVEQLRAAVRSLLGGGPAVSGPVAPRPQ